MKLRLLLFTLLFSALSWGQVVIDDTATGMSIPAGWSSSNVTGLPIQQGGYYLAQSTIAPLNDYIYSNVYSTINNATSVTIDVQIATYGSGTDSPLYVDMSLNGGTTWTSTQITAGTPTSSTYITTSVTFAGVISSSNVQFRFYDGVLGDKGVRIKNIVINATVPSTLSVTYDGNTNTGGTVPTDATVYNSGDTATVLGNTGSLVKTGFAFNGWNKASDGSGTAYVGGNTFNITANTTLYAQWLNTSPPVITSALTASGNQGSPFTYTITATNSPTSYNATGLPAGLTINTTTGVISGTPTVTGVFNITITATNGIGSDNQTLDLTLGTGPCFSDDFSSATSGNSTSTSGQSNAWSGNVNFPIAISSYEAGGAIKLGTGSSAGSITSASLASVSGNVTVVVSVKGWTTVEGDLIVTLNGISQTIPYAAKMADSFEDVSAIFTGVPAGSILKIETTAKRAFINKVEAFCTVIAGPEINVTGNTVTIVDNDTTPSVADDTNFGAALINTNIVKTFTIQNQGTTDLVLSSPITLSDVSLPQEFTIAQPAITTIPAGNSTTFTVTFNSAVAGTFTNTLNINSNDVDEALYNFDIIATATIVTPTTGTVFNPGELVFVGYDGQVNGSGSEDEYLIATLVDIVPGTSFSLVNSRYEAGAAANVRTNKWGGGGDDASEQPYEVKLTYNGVTNIPAGSVLRFETTGSFFTWISVVDVITGTTSTTRTSEFSGNLISGNPNISSSDPDQMYLMQGSFAFDGTATPNEANYYLSGTLLHGLTNRVAWVPITSACSGSSASGVTRESRLPAALTCFNVESTNSSADSGFYENDKQHGIATIRQIVLGISDVANNWTLSSGRYNIDPSSSLTTRAGKTFLIGPSNPAGQWVGNVDTNWFNCANWEGLAVPSLTTNVTVDATALNIAAIDYNAAYSNEYSDIAYSKDLIISGSKVQLEASSANILEVHGNIQITNTGVLDMDDSNAATADGTLHLFGNWTNTIGQAAFEEGNGTVYFDGITDQIVGNVTPEGTELFYDVVLNNNYTTSISNDLIATGNLTVNTGKSVVVSSDDYIQVNKDLTNNGIFTVQNNGSLVQVDDSGVNTGNISYERVTTGTALDYVYWSSPVNGVNTPATGYIFSWDPSYANPNTGWGYWLYARNTTMSAGVGYIMRDVFSRTFTGVPRNGVIQPTVSRANYTDTDFTGTNGVTITKFDDNWNLIGNPYPSSINALAFLTMNPNIEGAVRIWTHDTSPSTAISDPFYDDYVSNYTVNDYITHNGTGTVSGPAGFNGYIAGGQSFFVNMLDGSSSTESITFNNSLRSKGYDNSQFYKQAASIQQVASQKSRIWLDLVDSNSISDRTLIGYVEGATYGNDRMYDAVTNVLTGMKIYSIIDNNRMTINGRSLPFDNNDKVQLGIKTVTGGIFSIAISAVDGFFDNETDTQGIYLEDKVLNIIHDLRESAYTFYMPVKAELNDRFVLRYTDGRLSTDDNQIIENDVYVVSNDNIQIISNTEKIKSIEIYDVLGRRLISKTNVDANSVLVSEITKSNNALIVNIILENNIKISRKVLF